MLEIIRTALFVLPCVLLAQEGSTAKPARQPLESSKSADEPLQIRLQIQRHPEEGSKYSIFHYELGMQAGLRPNSRNLGLDELSEISYGEPIRTGALNENGTALVAIPWELVRQLGGPPGTWIWARLVDGDHIPMIYPNIELTAETRPGDLRLIQFSWTGNHSLRGRLLDPQGAPSTGQLFGMRYAEGKFKRVMVARSLASGEFSINFREPGTYWVRALSALGTAQAGPFELGLDTWKKANDIQLVGPGRLHGQVLNDRGQPVAGLDLWARTKRAEQLDLQDPTVVGNPERRFSVTPLQQAMEEEFYGAGAGRWDQYCTTDAEGRFELKGLRDDEFVIRARTEPGTLYGARLSPTPVASLGPRLELHCARASIAITLRDDAGEPLEIGLIFEPYGFLQFPSVLPEQPTVFVAPAANSTRGYSAQSLMLRGKRLETGLAIFDVTANADYLVVLMQRGRPTLIEQVRMEAGRRSVDLQLPPSTGMGGLSMTVEAPSGEALTSELTFQILDASTGLMLLEQNLEYWKIKRSFKGWPVELELPAGSYLLRVSTHPDRTFQHGIFQGHRRYGDSLTPFAVTPGQQVKVPARFEEPAQIALRLTGARKPEDVAASRRAHQSDPFADNDELSMNADIQLLPEHGYPIGLRFVIYANHHSSASGLHLLPSLPIDTASSGIPLSEGRAVSEPVRPGRYILQATMPGGRVRRQDVLLVAGKTLEVSLQF